MLEAVYFDTVEERAIVALKPKPAFRALFQIATTREGSGGLPKKSFFWGNHLNENIRVNPSLL